MKQLFLTALSVVLTFSFVYAENKEPIRIGWCGPLSGNSAVLGIDSVQAARIAIEEANASGGINGRKIELVVEDDQYDTVKALSAYNKLVNQDGVAAVLMSTYGAVFSTAERALADGVLVINPLDCNNDIAALAQNTFCIATESESIGRIIAEDIGWRGLKSVGIIFDQSNPFMVLVNKALGKRLDNLGKKRVCKGGFSQKR